MIKIRQLTLDVLKPHQPDLVEFARALAIQGSDHEISIRVLEVDEKTETLEITIEGGDIDFERIKEAIGSLGGSLHSVDAITVEGRAGKRPAD